MEKGNFLEFLRDHIILFDGAMGTMLYARGQYINCCYDSLNLSKPDLIRGIHKDYLAAGADVIETNTFGANRLKLRSHGFAEDLQEINRRGAGLAREVAGDKAWVAGSMGPLGVRIEPWGPLSYDEACDIFREQAEALLEGGVDLIIIETIPDLPEIQQAVRAVREISELPVIAQMTISDDGNSPFGSSPEKIARRLTEWGADIIGLNCSVGPKLMLEALEIMIQYTDRPISIQPNAGYPRNVEGRNIYLASPEYMAEYARRFIRAGAKVVGGCCGTTPDYIRAMRSAIRSLEPHRRITRRIKPIVPESAAVEAKPFAKRSALAARLAAGEFVTTVELVPPRGTDLRKALHAAQQLREAGVDAINLPEGPRALSRMGAPFLSKIIQDEIGIEAVTHYTCRDRNLLGIISDLLGMHAMGIRNLLLITGDPPKMGNLPDATAVFDVDSIGLVNAVHSLNAGLDLGGNPIGGATEYAIGVGVNPGAVDLDYELRRFYWKVDAGAEFAITQPVFDVELLLTFLDKIKDIRIPILAGIWPLVSLRNAEFMNNEVPGAHVPEEIMRRMRWARSKEEARRTGLEIAKEAVRRIRSHVEGVQISMPFGNVDYPLEVLSALER